MKKIVIIGGGGHCNSCIDVIEQEGIFSIKGIILNDKKNLKFINRYPVLGDDLDILKLIDKTKNVIIGIGQIKDFNIRKKIFLNLKKKGANFPTIKSPSAHLSRRANVGEGTILMHSSILNSCSKVGKNCIINTRALIEHDSIIGDHSHISTGAIINGGVSIGNCSFIGSGTVVKQQVKIGKNVIIGFGKSIAKDVPDYSVIK